MRMLAAGECVFHPGDAADAIYFLLGARAGGDGLEVDPLVQVELKPPSGKRTLRFERIVHGEIFGELELLEHGLMPKAVKRTTSAVALTPVAIVPLPLSLLSDLVTDDTVLRARLIRIGAQRLLSALTQQHEKVNTYPDLLLADWLVELSADIGIAEGNRVRFPRKIAQSDIAADLGVSRETISRRLNEWERSGLLRLAEGGDTTMRRAALRLIGTAGLASNAESQAAVKRAAAIATDSAQDAERRADAISLLALADPKPYEAELKELLDPGQPEPVELAAAKAIGAIPEGGDKAFPAALPFQMHLVQFIVGRIEFVFDRVETCRISPHQRSGQAQAVLAFQGVLLAAKFGKIAHDTNLRFEFCRASAFGGQLLGQVFVTVFRFHSSLLQFFRVLRYGRFFR